MPDLKKMLTLEALSEALPSWLKRSTKPEYNADEIDSTLTTNQFVTASDKDNWNAKGTYSKPSGGIPKSDLSSIVQTSLEKADSALQSETDPTVPSWAKQTNKPSYTQDEVADGTTYKRVTQTEKDAWSGKQNAITDLQVIRNGAAAGASAVQPYELATVEDQAMYAVTRTGKNCAVFPEIHTVGSITFTCDIVTGYITSSASNDPRAWNLANRNMSWSLPAGTYIVYAEAPDTNSDRVDGYVFNGDNIVENIAVAVGGTKTVEITLTTSGSIGLEIKPRTDKVRYMICPKSVFDADSTYQPPSLTNVTMTPALIEQVDGGAKNIFPIQSLIPYGPGLSNNPNLTCTNNNDGTYTLNGSTVASGTIHLCDWIEDTTYGGYVMSGCPKVNSSTEEKVRLALYTAAGSSGVAFDLGDGKQIPKTFDRSYLALYVFANKSFNNAVFKPMFCTLADWNASHKFVPHRPNYDLISYLAGAGGFKDYAHGGGIANADLNAISVTSFTAYNNPTNLPTGLSGWCYVRTYVYDTNGALQELFMIQTNPVSYFRIKSSGTWSAWIKTSTVS